MTRFIEKLQEPEVFGCLVDGSERILAPRQVLMCKRLIRDVFDEFHQLFHRLDHKYFSGEGMVVELGAGVYPVKESFPEVCSTWGRS